MNSNSEKRVTMKVLAEHLGVSKTTVSLALRGHSSISKSMREKVVKLAEEMNYRPDPAISAIAAKRWSGSSTDRHRVIAYLMEANEFSLGRKYYKGAYERAKELGFELQQFQIDDFPNGSSVSRMLYNRGIRGVIVPPIADPEKTRLLDLDWDKFTSVCCGIGRVRPPLHTVASDQFTTTRLVCEVLAKTGYKRVGVTFHVHDPIADEDWHRVGAASAAIRFLGFNTEQDIPILVSEIRDREKVVKWYKEYKPEVIIGFNFEIAKSLEAAGIKVPEDVELIVLFSQLGSKWSGITHHYDDVGRAAVHLLNGEMQQNVWGVPDHCNLMLIPPEWNRGSTFKYDDFAARYTFETTHSLHEVKSDFDVASLHSEV